MLELSTLYLLLAMAGFVCAAVVLMHRHNSADAIQRKEREVENISDMLGRKMEALEKEVVDLQLQIDEIDDQIRAMTE